MNTILSESLLCDVLNYFEKVKDQEFVVLPSLPILFFGDLETLIKQEFKIITVGLNPSNSEFRINKSDNYSFIRFPEFKGDFYSFELTLNNYFKNSPYKRWFNSIEPLLNGIGYSFYPNEFKKIVHTDICSPLSTSPTWSVLEKKDKNITEKLFIEGVELWKRLVIEIKPNLIIISTKYKLIEYLNPLNKEILYTILKTKEGKDRRPFNLELYDVSINGFKTKLIYGEPKNTPFGSVSTKDKIKMGLIIKDYFKL